MQKNCNRQGFNVRADYSNHARARIGIITNNEDDCISCDSKLGFGTARGRDGGDSNTCGNHCTLFCKTVVKAFDYILVQ